MNIVDTFSHRNGRDILESPKFAGAYGEFLEVLRGLPPYTSSVAKKTSAAHIIAPSAMNRWLDQEMCITRDWDWHPLIIEPEDSEPDEKGSQLLSDYRKSRIEVAVQFGNVARYAYDFYKMAIAMALGHSDVGIMVVCTKNFADITGGNIAYYERAVRELERSRLTLIVPLVVIGIEPESWSTSAYPPESDAPEVTARTINAARKLRGKPPVPEEPLESDGLAVEVLRSLAYRLAG